MKYDSAEIKQIVYDTGASLCGIGTLDIYDDEIPECDPKMILPNAKCIIGIGFAKPKSLYMMMENKSKYYPYTTLGVKFLHNEMATVSLLKTARYIEDNGYYACIQRTIPNIHIKGDKSVDPEITGTFEFIHTEPVAKGKPSPDVIIDFTKAAKACGLGHKGLHGKVINDKYGPFMSYVFIITDMPLKTDDIYNVNHCRECEKCVSTCPDSAISKSTGLDTLECAVYYKQGKDSNNLPIVKGSYVPCLCGKPCEIECYKHILGVNEL